MLPLLHVAKPVIEVQPGNLIRVGIGNSAILGLAIGREDDATEVLILEAQESLPLFHFVTINIDFQAVDYGDSFWIDFHEGPHCPSFVGMSARREAGNLMLRDRLYMVTRSVANPINPRYVDLENGTLHDEVSWEGAAWITDWTLMWASNGGIMKKMAERRTAVALPRALQPSR